MCRYQWRLVTTATIILALAEAALAQSYIAVILPTPPRCETRPNPRDLNDRLQAVGFCGDELIMWDASGVHSLGIIDPELGSVGINNRGAVTGTRSVAGRRELFEWVGGVIRPLPQPAGDQVAFLDQTENGILLLASEVGQWAAVDGTFYDLTALTAGARITTVNEAGTVAGSLGTLPYLRFLDGRVVRPSIGFPTSVSLLGAGGHFAGIYPAFGFFASFFVGAPDGMVRRVTDFFARYLSLNDMNRRGDIVGSSAILFGLPSAFVYRNNRFMNLGEIRTIDGLAIHVDAAVAINDAGYVLSTGRQDGSFVTVLLVPTVPLAPQNLTFAVVNRTVNLQWQESDGALDYVLEAGSAPGTADLFNGAVGQQPGLSASPPPGRYYVRIRARNGIGVSTVSTEVVIDVP